MGQAVTGRKACAAISETKKMLEDFLEHGAISQAQFDKSFGDLTEKMGMQEYENHID